MRVWKFQQARQASFGHGRKRERRKKTVWSEERARSTAPMFSTRGLDASTKILKVRTSSVLLRQTIDMLNITYSDTVSSHCSGMIVHHPPDVPSIPRVGIDISNIAQMTFIGLETHANMNMTQYSWPSRCVVTRGTTLTPAPPFAPRFCIPTSKY